MTTENERLAEKLLLIAARMSVDSPLGWGRPDCVTLQEAARVLRGEPKPKPDDGRADAVLSDDEVTPSCGCVFCDLDDAPEMINGALKHHYQGRDGRLVPCTRAV